jgi:hypothetical protein
VPEVPGGTEAPGGPEALGALGVPEVTCVPKTPGALGVPGASEAPEMRAPVKARRRHPALRLAVGALVLGVLAGGGAGYWVQQRRDPTPLAPLATVPLAQPEGAGAVPEALPPDEDGGAAFHGNLLQQMLPTPKGAHENDRTWLTLAGYASLFRGPSLMFTRLAQNNYQRGAEASWRHGTTEDTVRVIQFRDEATAYAPVFLGMESEDGMGGATPDSIPGVTNGNAWGSGDQPDSPGDEGYTAFADAQLGNFYVEVWEVSAKPIAASTVASLAKRQLERL